MVRAILRYFLKIVFEERFLIPWLFGTSYLTSLGYNYKKGGEVVFNAIPPLFWPILSASIVLAGVGLRIRDCRKEKKRKIIARRKSRLERTEDTFEKVRSLYMIIMQRGPDFKTWDYRDVTSEAWECVRSIRPELIEKRGEEVVPEIIDVGNFLSVREWYDFLIDEKTRCKREHEELSPDSDIILAEPSSPRQPSPTPTKPPFARHSIPTIPEDIWPMLIIFGFFGLVFVCMTLAQIFGE